MEILAGCEVYGRVFCIVIKTRGLRGEQFVSLSKQRGKITRHRSEADFGSRGMCEATGEDGTNKSMFHASMDLLMCQDQLRISFERRVVRV